MQAGGRIMKEFKEIESSRDAGIAAKLVDNQLNHWKGYLTGPADTPYAGGLFVVDIQIPENYPFVPPKMRFDTKVWHPNVSSANGAICLDILKNEWSPALTIRTALLSLQALLCAPNPDDPQDAVVASMYKRNLEEFNSTARFWTETYAVTEEVAQERKILKLTEMGFDRDMCRRALEQCNWDENRAVEVLFS
eukprot:TRINITY_DN7041_c0_g3_i7.p1 TRINITY_DN7041_c0_g3~~TRINITY_DN7041_c0_g3_i7.p1  ORF type:complete len:193 (+),score=40.49 TRINITY_DN7041_c0_g3_i7:81-659(+)